MKCTGTLSKSIHITILAFVLIFIVACVEKPQIKNEAKSISNVDDVELIFLIPQSEIEADMAGTQESSPVILNDLGTSIAASYIKGVFNAALENKRSNRVQQVILPVRHELTDFDFNEAFTNRFQELTSKVEWLSISKSELINKTPVDLYDPDPFKAKFIVALRYSVSSDFRLINIAADVAIVRPHEQMIAHLNDAGEIQKFTEKFMYKRHFVYQTELMDLSEDKSIEARKNYLVNNNYAKRSLVQGIEELCQLIEYDIIEQPAIAKRGFTQQYKVYSQIAMRHEVHPAKVIQSKSNGRLFIRLQNGSMAAIHESSRAKDKSEFEVGKNGLPY